MKKVAYTVCSVNHLAYAKTMADSFIMFNPEYSVIIGLVDKIDNRFDPSLFLPHTLIEISEVQVSPLKQMSDQYSLIELNCAVKSFMAQFILNTMQPDVLVYTDADIVYYHSLEPLEQELGSKDILLTPHMTSPVNDDKEPRERDILRSGIYNAGFILMRKSKTLTLFLNWWSDRMRTQCYYNFQEGMGVDQNWLNFVPLFFENVVVTRHPGANVAYWNLHEKKIESKDDVVFVNNEPLLFLHISGFNFNNPANLSKHQNRFVLSDFPVLNKLLGDYVPSVEKNGYHKFSPMKCAYAKPVKKNRGIVRFINSILVPIGFKLYKV
jgi:hypothetical protein